MHCSRPIVVVSLLSSLACGTEPQWDPVTDEEIPLERATIDEGALIDGATVRLTDGGTHGVVSIPLSDPLPEADPIAISMEMIGAVHCQVRAGRDGPPVELSAGNLVLTALTNPGEYRWETNANRDEVTVYFVNETVGGLSLHPGTAYTVTLSVTSNDYVQRMSALSFVATVVSG